MMKEQMVRIYREIPLDRIPWNIATPPEILVTAVTDYVTRTCRAIELGCGAGNHKIYFSEMGYDFTGADISENAIRIAFMRKRGRFTVGQPVPLAAGS